MPDRRKAQALAERVAAVIGERDAVSRFLGITVDQVGPGHARLSLTVTPDMLNGVGTCHGGISYTLADTAFAYACNSHNRVGVALSCTITYPAAAKLGDRLTADCREIHSQGRNGTYDCTVTSQEGLVVALFRGQCRIIKGHFVEGIE
ncbi:MAG: hydroxyphenylacetyl-CoA thioesterase PaaI [Phaeospirillum sp.]|nr:hydroxyphenylacetyl-CoA thioesterase PaaI [Phaeospirillum sp.]